LGGLFYRDFGFETASRFDTLDFGFCAGNDAFAGLGWSTLAVRPSPKSDEGMSLMTDISARLMRV
jgi:hypothetical protein